MGFDVVAGKVNEGLRVSCPKFKDVLLNRDVVDMGVLVAESFFPSVAVVLKPGNNGFEACA